MATDLRHLGIDDYESVEEIANGVSDDLTESLREAPGNMSSPEAVGAVARGVVLRMFGQEDE